VDIQFQFDTGDPTDLDVSTTEDADRSEPGCDFPDNPEKGEPGAACDTGADCDNGFCVDAPEGRICTLICVDCCPTGFNCESAKGRDTVFLCIPKLKALCRPCLADSECEDVNAGALCVAMADSVTPASRFCGGACAKAEDCPPNYACQPAVGTKGSGKQCVRTKGACGCSPAATSAGAATACAKANEYGSCAGQRKCTLDGLSDCDAPSPQEEVCNGADDDCNGQTDEMTPAACSNKNDAGTCTGLLQCVAGAPQCDAAKPVAEICNGADDDCDGETDENFPDLDKDNIADCVDNDKDGDGVDDDEDCEPLDPAISPTATEACNGIDDNCDGNTDEADATGCKTWWLDNDGDGDGKDAADGGVSQCLCAPKPPYNATAAKDCDDAKAAVHSKALEVCNDIDDDCDGSTDAGCDDDGDHYCDVAMQVVDLPAVCTKGGKDCDDTKAAVSPGNKEVCGNKLDDDCDGKVDSGEDAKGCTTLYKDADTDGYGAIDGKCLCAPLGLYTAATNTDCADTDKAIHPGAKEVCGNNVDEDCDGATNAVDATGCKSLYADGDGDGFGSGKAACVCAPMGAWSVAKAGDCDDKNPKVNPSAGEVCNGVDDDCNSKTDEADAAGCSKHYADGDGDGYGVAGNSACLCKPTKPWTSVVAGDCADGDKAVNPGAAEICDKKNNDCKGGIDDPGAKGCTTWFTDKDGDGWGDPKTGQCLCGKSSSHPVAKGKDCDDNASQSKPGGKEICDSKDNDCDGQTDEEGAADCNKLYQDDDGDGYGQTGSHKCLCKKAKPFTTPIGGDCADGDSAIHPKATEVCGGKDDDCDGQTDEAGAKGCKMHFFDADGDFWGTPYVSGKCLCKPQGKYTGVQVGDCLDTDKTVYPKAPEICDGKDNDCDVVKDEPGAKGCVSWYRDPDGDGWGFSTALCLCKATAPYSTKKKGDCDEGSKAINPGAKEICDGKDNDCNGQTDEVAGGSNFYADKDKDGWGIGVPKKLCKAAYPYTATKPGDCKDTDKTVYPGAAEVCDGKDNNCNKQIDETGGSKTFWRDSDGDGWGKIGDSIKSCKAKAPYTATKGGDCNDGNKLVNPGAVEKACNKIDDDCKGGDACYNAPCGTTLSTCLLACGGQSLLSNCWCDSICVIKGDCCSDRFTCCN